MYTLYILYSKDHNTIYIGETSNLIQRFYSHNFYGHDWSKRYRPWIVIYCEYFLLRTEAKNREKQLKGGKGENGYGINQSKVRFARIHIRLRRTAVQVCSSVRLIIFKLIYFWVFGLFLFI